MDSKIQELKIILAKAKIIKSQKKKGKRKVVLGSQVTLKADGNIHVFTLVGEWEADPMNKKISHNSPLGQALIGKKKGEKITIKAPAGKIVYEILKID